MKAANKNKIIPFLAIILCTCIGSTKPQFTQEIEEPNANFILYVSNQSFEKPNVDISITLDGKLLINDFFRVKNQHYWKIYSLNLSSDIHLLSVNADNGSYELEKEFKISNRHWAVISFWYTSKKDNDYQPSGITFEISNEPYGFL